MAGRGWMGKEKITPELRNQAKSSSGGRARQDMRRGTAITCQVRCLATTIPLFRRFKVRGECISDLDFFVSRPKIKCCAAQY